MLFLCLGNTGLKPLEIPKNKASIWTEYQTSANWAFGLGAVYQAKSYINSANTAYLPSYTRFDFYANYNVNDDYKVQLKMENLTDKVYFPNAHATHQATVGQPFNAKLTLIGRI